jgi:hypothetical protein
VSGSVSAVVRCVGGVVAHFDQPEGVSRLSTSCGAVRVPEAHQLYSSHSLTSKPPPMLHPLNRKPKVKLVVSHQATCRALLTALKGGRVAVKAGSCFAPDGQRGQRLKGSSATEDAVWLPEPRTGPAGLVAQVAGTLLPDVSRSELLGTGGKVDVAAARRFASSTSFFGDKGAGGTISSGSSASDSSGGSSSSSSSEAAHASAQSEEAVVLPEIRVAAVGNVTLESLSWRDSIKRQFGLA